MGNSLDAHKTTNSLELCTKHHWADENTRYFRLIATLIQWSKGKCQIEKTQQTGEASFEQGWLRALKQT